MTGPAKNEGLLRNEPGPGTEIGRTCAAKNKIAVMVLFSMPNRVFLLFGCKILDNPVFYGCIVDTRL